MNWIKIFVVFLFVLSCEPKDLDEVSGDIEETESRNRPRNRDSNDERADNSDRSDKRREADLRRSNNSENEPRITSVLEKRYSGSFASYADYDSEKCSEDSSCESLCDDLFSSRYRSKCYRSPREFVEELEEGLFTLINITRVDSVDISPAFVNGVLNIDEGIFVNLIEDKMSEGGIKRFLMWVAENQDISQVFKEEDRTSKVLESAFKRLGELESESSKQKRLATGLNAGLQDSEDTFLSLAVEEDNEYGFQIAYNLLRKSCSSKNCKLEVLCARESRYSSRSRVFGSSSAGCQTSTRQERRARSGGTCYVHGARVWSFLDELIEDDDINDKDFEDNPIKVNTCNTFCGKEDSRNEKCSLVL